MNNIPGSSGAHNAQKTFGTARRALSFYNKQVLNYLNPLMIVENDELPSRENVLEEMIQASKAEGGRSPELWVLIKVEEAYIHRSNAYPILTEAGQDYSLECGRRHF